MLDRAEDKNSINDFSGAMADYNKVITLDTKNAKAYLKRGYLENLGYIKGACTDFNIAKELNSFEGS